MLADTNRIPFDLPEAESESIAGFITEYSTIYFSIILLTEYANIIILTIFIIIIFSLYPSLLLLLVFIVSLIRSTFNRLKYDELMTNAWTIILPIISSFLLISIVFISIKGYAIINIKLVFD